MRELKELAITDLLTIPVEQAHLQLERLKDVEELFHTFWDRYYHMNIPTGSEHNLELILTLNLDDLFIAPGLRFFDQAIADDNFINDLESTIRYREEILQDFKRAVLKIVKTNKELIDIPVTSSPKKEIKAKPSFREDIIGDLFDLLKNYFSANDKNHLLSLLKSDDSTNEPLVFAGNGNQLADTFKQLFDANLIAGCNKAELQHWIMTHFVYREKGRQKKFTEKYLQDIISSNTKACKSPLFDVRRSEGRLYLFALTRNNKNHKR